VAENRSGGDTNIQHTMLAQFYKIYQDQFVTKYAATSPVEDIAESWAFFVLSPKPEMTSIANEKIFFFYTTNVEEEMAESFAFFVLNPKPSGDAVYEQKVAFCYEFPELVKYRQRIMEGLCSYIK